MRSVATAPLILSHWHGSLSLGKTKTISTTCVLQKSQSHHLHFGCLFVAAVQMSGGVCQPLCRKKKKKKLSGSLWDKCDYWVTCEEMAWTQATVGPSWNKASSLYLKERLYILCTNISEFFCTWTRVHVKTFLSCAEHSRNTHPQNSGHARVRRLATLIPKGGRMCLPESYFTVSEGLTTPTAANFEPSQHCISSSLFVYVRLFHRHFWRYFSFQKSSSGLS